MDYSEHNELASYAGDETFPSGKSLWKTGIILARRFKNKKFLDALYKNERTSEMMFRFFSGNTWAEIGEAFGVTAERARQVCEKGLFTLLNQLSYFTKDIVEIKGDEEDLVETKTDSTGNNYTVRESGIEGINGMRFSKRARTVFKKHGINNLEQLQRLSKSDLMRLPGLGRKTLVEIIRVLEYAESPESQRAIQLRPWTEADIEQVMQLERSGYTFQDIAAQVNRFPVDVKEQFYIRRRELRNGEESCDPTSQDSSGAKDVEPRQPLLWSEEEVSQLVSMRSRGMNVRDIAKQLQRYQRDVSMKLEELGLKVHYRNFADLTDGEKDELVSRFLQGVSLADLAEEQQVKQVDLAYLLMEKGVLPERNSRMGEPWSLKELDTLRGYIERDYPIGEIGYRLGREHREVTSQIYELIKSNPNRNK